MTKMMMMMGYSQGGSSDALYCD